VKHKVIQKKHGRFENEIKSCDPEEIVQRYWIDLKAVE
jgi:predicted acetyltransferase